MESTKPVVKVLEDKREEQVDQRAKVIDWEDYEHELARLCSLTSALEESRKKKNALDQKLNSFIQLPGEALDRVFKSTLDLPVAYKDQVAEAAKEEEEEEGDDDDDDMENFQTDDDDDDDVDDSDKEMGVDAEDGDEADSLKLQKLAAWAKASLTTESDDEDSDDDFSDDDELQSPIDDVDPFIFFVDTIKVLQASDPLRFQSLTQTLDFHYQALANGVAQHAEQRKTEIENEKLAKAAEATVAAA